jgi:hypothetical protein
VACRRSVLYSKPYITLSKRLTLKGRHNMSVYVINQRKQPGIDSGYNNVGFSSITDKKELIY